MSPPFQTAWSLLRLSAARLEFTRVKLHTG